MRTFKVLVLVLMLYLSNCQRSEVVVEEVEIGSLPEVTTIGQHSANRLVVALKSKIIEAIGQGGLVNAIPVCNEKGLFLTDSIARHSPRVISIKRTSYKYRNPRNAPDEIDRKILDLFIEEKNTGKDKLFLVIKGDTVYYRYYRPLTVGGLCANCHGDTKIMDKTLLEKINQNYPEDLARGYQVGDFRGVVCVSIED
jgi:hypothetical protein